ncbi:MAG: asparagine synthase (glutamine-hydrolyzing) [Chthoniobacter sp.]|uniref:asparagine synthase (glutamine-hydrolyzing) n=1 Tax=Chthoniobacter sp. TaxID=2510640 RepID=UPI0032A7DC85
MCGIAGFVGVGDRAVLQRMTDAIRYRGPDAEGHWTEESNGVYLGHRRLAIVDLSGGAQPMWTTDGSVGVIFNGEIYNHAELRTALKAAGCQFVTDHSDTEVLLHGYRQWGDAFVERLNGMWAFVIYDREKKRLFGSRDRFGKKPLYYFHEGNSFAWASELPALLAHPQCPRDLSALSLKKYFAYAYIPAPRSIYERVWKLPGGHSFSYDLRSGELKTWRYWEFVLENQESRKAGKESSDFLLSSSSDSSLDALCEEIRDTLERAVKRRLMSDVPLGVFLSGGIDSSAIAALAAKHVPAGQLNTFAIGFNEPSFDESAHARFVAERLGTKHREEILDLDKSVALLPDIIAKLDEPLGDGSLLPTYLLSRFTRQHVTVALGGDGGDELFAGYDPFRALQKAELYSKLVPHPVHEAIRLVAARLPVSHQNMSLDFKIKRTLMGLSYPAPLWNAVWMSALEPRELAQLFREPTDEEEVYSEAIEAWDRCAQPNIVDRALQFWTNLYLQDGIMAKVDRASMMNSLEARSPFLDIEFVELARRIPWQLKLRDGQTKWILKKALAGLVPPEIIERPKKGFGMPIGRWLREGRFEFDHARTFPHLDVAFAERKHAAHMSGQSDERLFLWSYWLLSQWMKK